MARILVHAWVVHKMGAAYYLPYTHWVYLREIVKYYEEVCLLSPVKVSTSMTENGLMPLEGFKNVTVKELPYSGSYMSAVPHLRAYINAYKTLHGRYDEVYARYPVPFGWLGKLYFKNKKRIIHFVGDPVDAAKTNPNFSTWRKMALISGFMPEHKAYLWACKGANVFTNGFHLKEKLAGKGIPANAVISTTLNEDDFYLDDTKQIDMVAPRLLYVGYLRKAKGVETVIRAFHRIAQQYPQARLTIVGSGEFEKELKDIAAQLNIAAAVVFTGHVDKRETLNEYLRSHDIFVFASLSEGSPRVILEAMANGINVVSTPVGSLPGMFKDDEDIVFAGFNDDAAFSEKIIALTREPQRAVKLRHQAYGKVKQVTIQQFIKKIFQ
ncbi:glycosyltransferase [Chitinophaga pendula]|uniref:glycosyltransferase n=1 Tax=Chitinophaga TaxID=79328 RepID=UPI000BAEFB2A|nr:MULTISPECIES: glycosyltransferase [Chitinophaga]ASZ12394.1 hypothetical protein CK934_16225 [Chitinophaga sp. MD30]UCJ10008.1 glycosyltransferase [Chitinophaga pendula]